MNRKLMVGILSHVLMENVIKQLRLADQVEVVEIDVNTFAASHISGKGPDVIRAHCLTDDMSFYERVNQYNSRKPRKEKKK